MKKTLRLILGDQLNYRHSWFNEASDDVFYMMMEMRQETDYVSHHIQKVVGFFSAMRAFKDDLEEKGHNFFYLKINDSDNEQSLTTNIKKLIEQNEIEHFEYLLPDEYRLDQQLKNLCEEISISTNSVETEHFLTERDDIADFFKGKKQFLMENFYRKMRKDHDILMEGTEPVGGKWNFDHDNRNKYKGEVPIPPAYSYKNDVKAVISDIEKAGIKTIGTVDAENFHWPIDRKQALQFARYFCRELLPYFGTYQDAMHSEEQFLFHSRISFALNSKLISPKELVDKIIEAWEENQDKIKIAQVEGYIRQVIGWREYMRGIYWAKMPGYAEMNFFEHDRKLPDFYWTGKTKMKCMEKSIKQSLTEAYAHHIQRLMVTGNFALLNMTDPDEVDQWYLGIYIDAIEWVEITNTRGMSQFADGGIVGSKPYLSSANYMHKMSNYCSNCYYDHKKKVGEKACPFNSLYWNFYNTHRDKLAKNQRIAMMYRTWDKKSDQDKEELLKQADYYLEHVNEL
ncbi:cryptochrome/photolyase family protein [Marivirga tractuosa]|uniref:Deoxyribodipyrimidine photolyase-related protein n=1 Tax=Marivirga tractuosa (strain ATCC 23168 / DSM 4126 / NBRC 15989 / NCIMB 1408 / VKM B-1430 / H-43) TaxID=643867 RepID=E4TUL0_MARTH|nr:cryptochrome/photolyase family protein [Marivirga tractuosa]ADR23103.1 deoxyribodipyrimidine photolyase-related protein [Marivirga tractuosa DSM 4126]BDD16223.1 cryptochrome/photolyase family protein [Marivirga tractuosa]